MHDASTGDAAFWSIAELVRAYRNRDLSPVEMTEHMFDRIDQLDDQLHSYLSTSRSLALEQASEAERRYRESPDTVPPLLGVPVSIKDLFDVDGLPTTLGSVVHSSDAAAQDAQPVAALRRAGAIFLGKSNTAEFGQSATTDNLLGADCANPWDPARTAGGSSGGAAAGVAAGLATAALGSDGGGSIRVPAAMCGVVGLKPTIGRIPDHGPFKAMTEFVCPGPIARTVADVRILMEAHLGESLPRTEIVGARIGWCPSPLGHPVDPGVAAVLAATVARLEQLGHVVEQIDLPLDGWREAFGPLVLADEYRYRRDLLEVHSERLTRYARRSLEAALAVTAADVDAARALKEQVTRQMATVFDTYDFVLTPTVACVAFPLRHRPTEIAGRPVDRLWGPFPFTGPFNVAGTPAASIPCGLSDGLPVGLQVVGPTRGEQAILDLCESIEETVEFPAATMRTRWRQRPVPPVLDGVLVEHREDRVTVFRLDRVDRRNAMTRDALEALPTELSAAVRSGARAVVITGSDRCFSAGMDLAELQGTAADVELDRVLGRVVDAIAHLSVPVFAAIEGPCVGAAVELAVACDMRVAGAGSYFQVPAATLGLLYRPSGTARLVAELGRQTVSRLLVCGERISADDARAAGIVAQIVSTGEAFACALALATVAAGGDPDAVRLNKQLITEVTGGASVRAEWEPRRMRQLSSDARRRAVADAKARVK